MKIGIITLYDPLPNYGNRLQNYAVQHLFRTRGFETDTFCVDEPAITLKRTLKYYVYRLSLFSLTKNTSYWKYMYPRAIVFHKFNSKYIDTRYCRSIEEVQSGYDYYAIGSDQIWNPTWYGDNKLKQDLFLLRFESFSKKICISPSFGVEKLPTQWKKQFCESLSEINAISVRENAGADIIRELIGKNVPVLLDPTLMLDYKEWSCISQKPTTIDVSHDYILTYFLGDCHEKAQVLIRDLEEQYNCKVYQLMNLDKRVSTIGPSEFLYLIAHAKIILTDSFHACVFSFIYQKPFLVYERQDKNGNMMSRIDTFLAKFDLERKRASTNDNKDLFECDYERGYIQLQQEKEKMNAFIDGFLNQENL